MAKKIIVTTIYILMIYVVNAQSLSLRPYYGRKFFHGGKNNIDEGSFDKTYSNNIKSSKYLVGIGLEYEFKKNNSVELIFTSQQIGSRFYSSYTNTGSLDYSTIMSYSQIQGIYNKGFNKNFVLSNKLSLIPIASIGIGVGFVRDPSKFGDDKFYSIMYGPNGNNFETTINTYRDAAINYSFVGRLGFAIKHKNKEILRLLTGYTLGVNKAINQTIAYSQGTDNYRGKVSYAGSNFNISISHPLVLYKKK
jgi:hypothetical protein